jgi:uncharacterized membrane protein
MTFLYFSVCFFGWGVAIFLMTVIGKNLEHRTTLVCNLIGYLLVNLFVISKAKWDWTLHHGLAVLVGVLFVISNLAYYQLSKLGGQASVLAPLTGLYVLVPVVLGWLVLGEPPTLRKWFGLVLALAAIWLLSASGSAEPGAGGG